MADETATAVDAGGNKVSPQGFVGDGSGLSGTALDTSKPATDADVAAKAAADKATADAAKAAADAAAKVDPAKAAADKAAADKATADAATALAAAEKAVADAKTPAEKETAQKALDALKAPKDVPGKAPEAYAQFKLPEGVEADPAQLKAFEPVAKELNLSQSQAQKLIDFQAAQVKAQSEQAATQAVKTFNSFMDKELETAKADPEVGGANWDHSIADAKVFIDKCGTPALAAYMAKMPAGNNVEIIRAFAKAGAMLKNDTIHFGGKPTTEAVPDIADRLFPTTAKK